MIREQFETKKFAIASCNPPLFFFPFITFTRFAPLIDLDSHIRCYYKNFQNFPSENQIRTFNPGLACECSDAADVCATRRATLFACITRNVKFKCALERSAVSAESNEPTIGDVMSETTPPGHRSCYRVK